MPWIVFIQTPSEKKNIFEEFFSLFFEAVTAFPRKKQDIWVISGITASKPEQLSLENQLNIFSNYLNISAPKLKIKFLKNQNWIEKTQQNFPPIKIGRFSILDKHHNVQSRAGNITLRLSAGNSFGSGHHETTQSCLYLLEYLAKSHNFYNILDFGCGSGILSIACAKLWHSQVTSVDIDKNAIEMTQFNSIKNSVFPFITITQSDGGNSFLTRKRKPFDLIVCNILAYTLRKSARSFIQNLQMSREKTSYVILSGILENQSGYIVAHYRNYGLRLVCRVKKNGWETLLLQA